MKLKYVICWSCCPHVRLYLSLSETFIGFLWLVWVVLWSLLERGLQPCKSACKDCGGLVWPSCAVEKSLLILKVVTYPFTIILSPVTVLNQLTSINEHELFSLSAYCVKSVFPLPFALKQFSVYMRVFALEDCAALPMFSTYLLGKYISVEMPVCMKRGVSWCCLYRRLKL